MDIKVWNRDEIPLTGTEIAHEEKVAAEIRAGLKSHERLAYRFMDRKYIKALHKGLGRAEALSVAEGYLSLVIGIIIGVVATLLVVGTAGWAWNLYLVARGINLVLALVFWLALFALGISKVRRGIVSLWRRFRPKEAK